MIESVDAALARDTHLSAIAAFGRYALGSRELKPVFDEAIRVTVEALAAACGAILQIAPDGTALQLRGSAGWNDQALHDAVKVNIPGRDCAWGILAIHPHAGARDDESGFLQTVATMLGLWLENALADADRDREMTARTAAESALERYRGIESITDSALQSLALDDLLQELLTRVRGALRADYASVAMIDAKRQELYIRAVSGRSDPRVQAVRAPLGHGVSGKIAAEGQPRIVDDLDEVDLSRIAGMTPTEIRSKVRSVIGVPLRVGGKVVGVVTAASPEPHHFNDDNLKLLLVVADRAAPAIERAHLIETVRAGQARLKALSARLLSAQEEERRRIAVELHDELGQVLTAVKIQLQKVAQRTDAQSQTGLREAIQSVDRAIERVRDLALDLRPAMLDDLGLLTALRWYAHRFARDTRIDVHFAADGVPRLEPLLETVCFRVVQEALTNVMRHAEARHVWVELSAGAGEIGLTIRDDGVGFDVTAARQRAVGGISVGILGMEERVSSLGGEFEVQSTPGTGTRLSARFPMAGTA